MVGFLWACREVWADSLPKGIGKHYGVSEDEFVDGLPSPRQSLGQKTRLLASFATTERGPSGDPGKLEHVFDLSPSSWKTWIKALETRIPKLMRETSVPRCSVVLIRDATIYWRRGFGVRDAERRQSVDNGTVFEAASASKPVFAYVVMKLAENGIIDLDVPLTKYTNERYVSNDPRLDLITARHVLMHASGFPNWRSADDPMATWRTS
jgi:CubicO group peptidase (beta-lactamase class C family)